MHQLEYIEEQMNRSYSGFADSWKVATVFIGLADAVFHEVEDGARHTPTPPDEFRASFRALLQGECCSLHAR